MSNRAIARLALIGACILLVALCTPIWNHQQYKKRRLFLEKYGDPKSIIQQLAAPKRCNPGKIFAIVSTGVFNAESCHTYPPNAIIRHLFPEYDFTTHGVQAGLCGMPVTEAATENDLLLATLSAKAAHRLDDILKFPGKIIFINPGVFDLHPSVPMLAGTGDHFDYLPSSPTRHDNSLVVLGPHEDSPTSVRVHLMALLLLRKEQDAREKIFYSHKKPNTNSKQFFMIYAVSHCIPYREIAAKEITTRIGRIHVIAGKCQGNPEGNPVDSSHNIDYERAYGEKCSCQPLEQQHSSIEMMRVNVLEGDSGDWKSNEILLHDYRFALVMESTGMRKGYITEKIINAFLAGTVPVYYGNKDVFDIFNPKAFVFMDPANMEPAIQRIAYLEQNSTAYDEMVLKEPILKDGMATLNRYFSLSDEIGDGSLKKKIRERLGFEDDCSLSTATSG